MRILFIADGRSPTALNWISYFSESGHEVHLVSTFPAKPDLNLASFHTLPVAFGRVSGQDSNQNARGIIKRLTTAGMRTRLRQWLGPLTLPKASKALREIIQEVQPDLVHALRIPYEGMLAALADPQPPLLISVWGNDFTLHGKTTPLMRTYTRRAARRADALMADCQRDIRLAKEWGFDPQKPNIVLPGGGGLQLEIFYPPTEKPTQRTVINPRGMRAYVRNDAFFRAVPLVLAALPGTRFLCPAMAGEPQAERWVKELGIEEAVDLLPPQSRMQMAGLFRQSQVAVSPSEHDGTPNTLLEAMACGCFPVAGDIESVGEWIEDGLNGLLVDPGDPSALAAGIVQAFNDEQLRQEAQAHNLILIVEKATYRVVMEKAEGFYKMIVSPT